MSVPFSYSPSRKVTDIRDCHFYHVMEIPGFGLIDSTTTSEWMWDLRDGLDDYLGNVSFRGKKVLEIGPASGFLTFNMEKKGAEVVCVEVKDDPGWDFVPFPAEVLGPMLSSRQEIMRRLKNSWWFAHDSFQSKATIHYGDIYNLPEELGQFDIAVLGSILLHVENPLRVISQCSRFANTLIISDFYIDELVGNPVMKLVPSIENNDWGTWFNFSPNLLVQFLEILGYDQIKVHRHSQKTTNGCSHPIVTVVARKKNSTSCPETCSDLTPRDAGNLSEIPETGRCMIPSKTRDGAVFWQHLERYRFAVPYCRDRRVVDFGSGEGYGTAGLHLSGVSNVIGIEEDKSLREYARKKYQLDFREGIGSRIPLESASVDTIVALESIENLDDWDLFFQECQRVLVKNGTLIFSAAIGMPSRNLRFDNIYHNVGVDEGKILSIINQRFTNIQLYTQNSVKASRWSIRSLSSSNSGWTRLPGYRILKKTMTPSHGWGQLTDTIRESASRLIADRLPFGSALWNPCAVRLRTDSRPPGNGKGDLIAVMKNGKIS